MTIWGRQVERLGDSNWTFGPLWISVLGRGFLLGSRLQRRFSLCQSVLERLWTLLKCDTKQLNTDNRLQDPRLCACSRRNATFLSPKHLSAKCLVAQTSVHRWATYARDTKQQRNELKTDVCDVFCANTLSLSQWWESLTCYYSRIPEEEEEEEGSCIPAFNWCQNQRPWMTLKAHYALSIKRRASFGAHHKNLNEDRLYCQWRRCSAMTLDSGNIRFVRLFPGVPWRGGVKRQWGNQKSISDATSSAP